MTMSNFRDHAAEPEGRDTQRRQALVQQRADALYQREYRQHAVERESAEYQGCREEAERFIPLELAPFRDGDLTARGFAMLQEYRYTALDGVQLYFKRRYENPGIPDDKRFKQGRYDVNSPTGIAANTGPTKVPYRWPELHAADPAKTVYWCEGEKDVETCIARGLVATTAADQISVVIANAMQGRNVVVLVDNDSSGEAKAEKAVNAFRHYAASLRVVRLPRLAHKEDITDWLERREGSIEELALIVEATEL